MDQYPDLLILDPVTKSIQSNFKIPEIHFENPVNFVSHIRSSTLDIFFKSLNIKKGKIHIQMIRKYILVSRRLFDFLRVNYGQNVLKHGDGFVDPDIRLHGGDFYIIKPDSNLTLKGHSIFDLNYFVPKVIKIVSDDIMQYLSGGGYRKHIGILPVDYSTTTTFFPLKSKRFLS